MRVGGVVRIPEDALDHLQSASSAAPGRHALAAAPGQDAALGADRASSGAPPEPTRPGGGSRRADHTGDGQALPTHEEAA